MYEWKSKYQQAKKDFCKFHVSNSHLIIDITSILNPFSSKEKEAAVSSLLEGDKWRKEYLYDYSEVEVEQNWERFW